MRLVAATACLAALLLNGCAPLPAAFDDARHGTQSVTSGTAFGVSIGMSREEARAALLHNSRIRYDNTRQASHPDCCGGTWHDPDFGDATEADDYVVTGLMDREGIIDHGVIRIFLTGGYVSKIEWLVYPFSLG